MTVYEDQCRKYNLDPERVASVARRVSRAAKEARAMGLVIFGGAGSGSLRAVSAGEDTGTRAEVADLGLGFDGGDGGDE